MYGKFFSNPNVVKAHMSGIMAECSKYLNIQIYSWIFLTNNIHIRICSHKKLQIIFIFVFVVEKDYEYYSYSYSFSKQIICFAPNYPIIVEKEGVFIHILT